MSRIVLLSIFLLVQLTSTPICAQDSPPKKPVGPPPMLVKVEPVVQGESAPVVERIGTVYYARVSRVAAELSGLVEQIYFTEGSRVEMNQPLLRLRSDLLKKTIASSRANYEQTLLEQEHANKELQRIEALFSERSVSESIYDNSYYRALELEKKAAMLKSNLDKQLLELDKTTITAPFSGIVQKKETEQGEWVSTGREIALIADDREFEIHVDVPQQQLTYLKKGTRISIRCAGQSFTGVVSYVIPKGNIATRSFTIKLQVKEAKDLIEGMEAYAQLPAGSKQQSLLVPRDAIVKQSGQDVVFIETEGKAKMIPIQINGYQGMQAAISSVALLKGMQVVVKGNERIRDGQAIRIN